jgi:hypothetical protein
MVSKCWDDLDVRPSGGSSRFEQDVSCYPFGFSTGRSFAACRDLDAAGKAENRTNGRKEADIEKVGIAVMDGTFLLRRLDEMRCSLCHPVKMAVRYRSKPLARLTTFKNCKTMKVRVAGTDVDQSADTGAELIGRRLRWLRNGGVVQNAQAALKTVGHHSLPQAIFGFEVIKQKALRDLGVFRNLSCGCAGKAIRRKAAPRGTNDPRPRCFWKVKCVAHDKPLPVMGSTSQPP